jgi:hypothetical protein
MMGDTAYDGGVDTESVCAMVDDIAKCITGRSSYVKMPSSLNHNGPVVCLEFVDDNNSYPTDLNPRSYKSSGTNSVSTSIASRARFRIRDTTVQDKSENDSGNRDIIMNIDDALDRYSGVQRAPSHRQTKASKSVMSNRSGKSARSGKSVMRIIEDINDAEQEDLQENDIEDDTEDMQDMEEEAPPKRPSSHIPPRQSTSRNVEIKMGTPASRYRT